MTIHQFPAYRIVRTEAEVEVEKEKGQGITPRITPIALFFFPARLWINCCSRWMDLMIEAEPDTKVTFHFGRSDRK